MTLAPHVLLADPDALSRNALALLLKNKLGWPDICEAADWETLTSRLATGAPDILLMDYALPGRPVCHACCAWRQAYPNLRLVILSVDASHSVEAEAVGALFIHRAWPAEQVLAKLRTL